MKSKLLLITSLLLLVCLSSCKADLVPDIDRFQLPTIEEETVFSVGDRMRDGEAFRNLFYFAYYEQSGLYTLDLTTGEVSLFSDELEEVGLVATDVDGIYVWDVPPNELVALDFDGNIRWRFAMPAEVEVEGDGYKTFWEIDHFDGLLALAGREAVWTLADGEEAWQKVNLKGYMFNSVLNVKVRDRSTLLINMVGSYDNDSHNLVIRCSRKGKNARVILDESIQSFDITDGHIYIAKGSHGIFEVTEKGNLFLMNPEVPADWPIIDRVMISNGTMLLFSRWQTYVTTYPFDESGLQKIKILLPASERPYLRQLTDTMTGVSIQYEMMDDETYFTKLTTKLLAEDTDFDLAILSGNQEDMNTFLQSMIENDCYADLYIDPALSENLGEMYPAVRDLVEIHGKMYVLPLHFEERFFAFYPKDTGIQSPPLDWNAEDLWALCEEARQKHLSVFSTEWGIAPEDLLTEMIVSAVSTLVHPGSGLMTATRERQPIVGITYILRSFRENQDVLFGSDALIYQVGDGILDLSNRYPLRDQEGLLLLPSSIPPDQINEVTGKMPQPGVYQTTDRVYYGAQPIRMTSAIYVNPNAANLAGAYAFLTELTGEENRYSANFFGSPLYPGLDRYYRDNDVPGEWGKKNRFSLVFDFTEEFYTALDPIMNDYYEASAVNLFAVTDRAKDTVADFVKGTLSVEDAAEILYQELVYTLKG